MKRELYVVFIFWFLYPDFSIAATLTNVNVEKQGKHYILHVKALIKADTDEVKRIVTDYENLPSINPYLKESKIVSVSDEERKTVSMLTEACILLICYKIRHIQVFHTIGANIVYGLVIPDKSDFKYGWTRWTIQKSRNSDFSNNPMTEVILDGDMEPDFFILPVIGPYHLKKKILEIATITIDNLEKEAQKFSDIKNTD